jgi:hypothetical protein
MYVANQHFGNYRIGDNVPVDLPNNDQRLKRGLIREVKVIQPQVFTEQVAVKQVPKVNSEETRVDHDVKRKPKSKTEQSK